MARILIVDDEPGMRQVLRTILRDDGHEVTEAAGLQEARHAIGSSSFDVLVTDQRMPDGSGLSLLDAVSDADSTLPVIVMTAYATVELAVEAMRRGAFDFITKPFVPEAVAATVRRACERTELLRENVRLRGEVRRLGFTDELVGDSAAMAQVRERIQRAAPTDATILIVGETGTGKELVARAIHRGSPRAQQPFVPVNCAALSETLLESELFGHEKGAFTGAERARAGLFETADRGTLFLDEAGEMPLSLQAKLLRVLVDGQVTRVGSNRSRVVDVRVVAATHRDLAQRIEEKKFREDLYYRLAVVPLPIPPLRERPDDIDVLVRHFLKNVAADLKVSPRTISSAAMAKLRAYRFPGNIRELRNLIERAYILALEDEIGPEDFPVGAGGPAVARGTDGTALPLRADDLPQRIDLRETLQNLERDLIRRALRAANGVQAEAARALGISRSDLSYKLKKYDTDTANR